MIYMAVYVALMTVGIAIWLWRDDRREAELVAKMTPAERWRHEIFMIALPQTSFDAELLNEAIERGDYGQAPG